MKLSGSTISSPNPCSQNWDAMTDIVTGKYCGKCQHAVIDFSKMSNDEILNYLSLNAKKKTCARIQQDQIDSINKKSSFISSSWSKMKTTLLASILFTQSCSTYKDSLTEKNYYKQDHYSARINSIVTWDIDHYLVRGEVIDHSGKSVIEATLYSEIEEKGTSTGINGQFEILLSKELINNSPNPKLLVDYNYHKGELPLDSIGLKKKISRENELNKIVTCIGIIGMKQPWYKRILKKIF